ncbi:MAG: cation transporter, partial [Rectinemataceae bacterium]|nr:cation transporter [Rectinemataceae bacterium]
MDHSQTYRIRGMHCASCASIIEKALGKVEGVHSIAVNIGTEAAKISFDETKTNREHLSKTIEPLGYSLVVSASAPTAATSTPLSASEMGMSESEHAAHLGLNQSKAEKLAEIARMRTKILAIMPMAAVAIVIMAWNILAEFGSVPALSQGVSDSFNYLLAVMATYALFVVGKPYLLGFYRFLRYGVANMDTLIGIGTSVAFL